MSKKEHAAQDLDMSPEARPPRPTLDQAVDFTWQAFVDWLGQAYLGMSTDMKSFTKGVWVSKDAEPREELRAYLADGTLPAVLVRIAKAKKELGE